MIVIGDLNARFGEKRKGFIEGKELPQQTHYNSCGDNVKNPNSNARYIQSALRDLVLLNGLNAYRMSNAGECTYRKGTRWISELDSCLVSPALLPAITQFDINQSLQIPSDHAPISLSLSVKCIQQESDAMQQVLARSANLGTVQVEAQTPAQWRPRRPMRMESIDVENAKQYLSITPPPAASENGTDINQVAEELNATLYSCALRNQKAAQGSLHASSESQRWEALLISNDAKALWKAINWNGCITDENERDIPDDSEFQAHFETLLNPPDAQQAVIADAAHLPVTDDAITPLEVDNALRSLKKNKSGGPSGIPPGLLTLLPDNWIVYLATFFSAILHSAQYPDEWTRSRLITIFKKGDRLLCDNYRGIVLMDSIAKLYDVVLNQRLKQWFQPDREQAGAQQKRGCLEHLLTLRLLTDSARHTRQKLYVIFVDFSKAYDRVPRATLLTMMQRLGCGTVMVKAIAAAYGCTQMILRTAIVTTSVGVRQGSPTSCLLFTLLVNQLIRKLKECPPDGFLEWLHCLMLMDDAVIFATTEQKAREKVRVLQRFCSDTEMVINQGKTKYMVINGKSEDQRPLIEGELAINHCQKYCYLGAMITQDGKITSAVEAQCEMKKAHVIKFEAYTKKNASMPFPAKRKVFEAALTSAILYSCETWLSPAACRVASTMYAACVKILLGVRKTTATDLCLVELGLPSLSQYVRTTQKKAIEKLVDQRQGLMDDPFMLSLRIARESRSPAARYISTLEAFRPEDETADLHTRIRQSDRTKFITYVQAMNPTLAVHDMYAATGIREAERLTASRIRLSSHNLAIEKGRWSRLPREERLCKCGSVQDEQHVAAVCPETRPVRVDNPGIDFSLPALFDASPTEVMLRCVHKLFIDFT